MPLVTISFSFFFDKTSSGTQNSLLKCTVCNKELGMGFFHFQEKKLLKTGEAFYNPHKAFWLLVILCPENKFQVSLLNKLNRICVSDLSHVY